jgi:hypothetical protein
VVAYFKQFFSVFWVKDGKHANLSHFNLPALPETDHETSELQEMWPTFGPLFGVAVSLQTSNVELPNSNFGHITGHLNYSISRTYSVSQWECQTVYLKYAIASSC